MAEDYHIGRSVHGELIIWHGRLAPPGLSSLTTGAKVWAQSKNRFFMAEEIKEN
jgi:hypothetical protein